MMSLPPDPGDTASDAPLLPEPVQADRDSALGDEEDDLESTASLTASIFDYREENGRTYNRYGDRVYVLPNDEQELDRLDLQHHILRMTFGPGLSMSGVEKQNDVHRVLDVGTGTGIWAIEYGDLHPESIVIGIDISPIQPAFVPPNVQFEIADVEHPWTFTYKFDFIFSRMMTGAVTSWRRFVEQSYENMTPGGSLEIQDISFHLRSDDGTLPKDSAFARWAAHMLEASLALGAPLDSVESVKSLMVEVGFVDVQVKVFCWPTNSWPADPKLKTIGMWTYHNFTSSLTGISVALFTRGLGWSTSELEAFLADVRKDMKRTAYHAYWPMYAIYGKKPKGDPDPAAGGDDM